MELRWTFEAMADRDAIYDYIEADNPAAAHWMGFLRKKRAA